MRCSTILYKLVRIFGELYSEEGTIMTKELMAHQKITAGKFSAKTARLCRDLYYQLLNPAIFYRLTYWRWLRRMVVQNSRSCRCIACGVIRFDYIFWISFSNRILHAPFWSMVDKRILIVLHHVRIWWIMINKDKR